VFRPKQITLKIPADTQVSLPEGCFFYPPNTTEAEISTNSITSKKFEIACVPA
jgi:hypothetical protein